MRSKHILLLVFFLLSTPFFSQSNLNNFKYVIVPKKFEFLKETDQYQLNSLTKFLLEKENFITFFDDENFPDDLAKDRCLALTADVIDESGLLKTKLKVQLQDCKNTIVFESRIGDSKLKAYEKAYQQSIREAFQSFKSVNYSYDKKSMNIPDDVAVAEPIKEQIPEPIKADKIKEVKEDPKPILPAPETPETPEIKEVKSKQVSSDDDLVSEQSSIEDILYAQRINNGFQLVDRTPKVVYTIYYSGKKDIYIVKGKDAVIYKLNDIWVISEMLNGTLKTENINIKF